MCVHLNKYNPNKCNLWEYSIAQAHYKQRQWLLLIQALKTFPSQMMYQISFFMPTFYHLPSLSGITASINIKHSLHTSWCVTLERLAALMCYSDF